MASRLVASLWCASALLATQAVAGSPSALTQEQLSQPDAVAAWLIANGSKADVAVANSLYVYGEKAKQRKDWSAAGKAFAESALHYPTPRALSEYATARLRMQADLKSRNRPSPHDQRQHLELAVSTYKATLAADSVLKQLGEQERLQVQRDIECLAEYLSSSERRGKCRPLELYGIGD